jgi:hypothetical protein
MKLFSALTVLLIAAATAVAQTSPDPLATGFENPPNSARPRVWWHWMNGNITQEGIKLDLEWMHRIGLGGFQNFDAAMHTPQVVDHRLVYMTPEWKRTFLYATRLADQLGLEEAIASSPGWSETGGPWVPPAEGMKKYVWSETTVNGGKPFAGVLAKPPDTTGPFQNVPFVPDAVMPGEKSPNIPTSFYRDSSVFAYRLPKDDVSISEFQPKVTTSGGDIDAALLTDGDFATSVSLPSAPVGEKAWIRYEFPKPVTIQSVTLALAAQADPPVLSTHHGDSRAFLEASDDGKTFRDVVPIGAGDVGTTLEFTPVTARFFRVAFLATPPRPPVPLDDDSDGWMGIHPQRTTGPHFEQITELVLSPGARVQHYQEKAAFVTTDNLYPLATPEIAPADAIAKADVVDLTSRMQGDGRLDWTPPAGRWVIVRMGYTLLGITNHPATAEATGLEVDKLNHLYVKNYMDHYLDNYESAVGAEWMGKRGVRYVVTDSWEAGAQNWTDNMIAEFTKRRGYDPRPWLPVLTGHVVESAEASDAFLWDFRKTIADLIADEHYGQVQASLKERGLGHYGESHEDGRALIADGMEVKKLDDVPMSAMWVQSPGVNRDLFGYNADDRESASVAHIYGQNLAAAESMTAVHAPWAWSPATLKPTADKELAEGINRFVIHCSVHQPLIGKAPGLGLGPYGQWFNRNDTWAEQARPWIEYLARSSYLLQQGHFGADVLYFYGEDSNITSIFEEKSPDVPEGYGFDYVNADALIHMFRVSDGKLTTASGMRYQVLALDPYSKHMSLPVLRSIRDLVQNGAVVVGDRPADTPSLADDANAFKSVVEELWGTAAGEHDFGNGKVYSGMTLTDALAALQIPPDFSYTKPEKDTNLLFVHRRLADGDLYYVDNRKDRDETFDATFRVSGREAELWHAETGKMEPASYSITKGQTTVPLHLEPWGTVFVVFRKPASKSVRVLPKLAETQIATVNGPWKISFQPGRGAPATITLNSLNSWSDNGDTGVKYFSGTGTYNGTMTASLDWFRPGAQLWMDLGDVKNLAEVTVNGKPLGTVWHTPYRVNVTGVLKPGANEVTIKVTNAWVNRLIGDLQPDAKQKYTFIVIHPYTAESPRLPSGLIGPVTIQSIRLEPE